MAGGTDFSIKLKADLKALREMRKDLDKFSKDQKLKYQQQMKLEGKQGQTRKRELQFQLRMMKGMAKDELKHQKDLQKAKKTGRTEEWAHQRAIAREQSRAQRETSRWMRKEERALKGGLFRRGLRTGGRALKLGAGLAGGLAGMFIGGAIADYQKYVEYQKALGGVIGAGRTTGRGIPGLVGASRGASMGYNLAESAQNARIMARSTGVAGPRELQYATRAAMLAPGEAGQFMGAIRQAGYGFAGGQKSGESAGARQLKNLLSAAIYSGLERARFPEFAQGVFKIVDQQGQLRTGRISPSDVAKILATFGKTGLEGMKGARGAAVAQKLQTAFMQPGGGEWGKAFFQMAMGFGKPGGTASYYEAEKQREKGLTSGNAQRLLKEVIGQFGGGEEGALALRELTGVGLEQAEALLKIGKEGDFSKEKLSEIDKILDSSKSLEQQALDQMKGNGRVLKRLAGMFNENVKNGRRVAPAVEKVQDWQRMLFSALLDIAEKIGKLYEIVKGWILDNMSTSGEAAKAIQNMEDVQKKKLRANNIQQLVQAAQEEVNASQAAGQITSKQRGRSFLGNQVNYIMTGEIPLLNAAEKAANSAQQGREAKSRLNRAKQYVETLQEVGKEYGINLGTGKTLTTSEELYLQSDIRGHRKMQESRRMAVRSRIFEEMEKQKTEKEREKYIEALRGTDVQPVKNITEVHVKEKPGSAQSPMRTAPVVGNQ